MVNDTTAFQHEAALSLLVASRPSRAAHFTVSRLYSDQHARPSLLLPTSRTISLFLYSSFFFPKFIILPSTQPHHNTRAYLTTTRAPIRNRHNGSTKSILLCRICRSIRTGSNTHRTAALRTATAGPAIPCTTGRAALCSASSAICYPEPRRYYLDDYEHNY